MNFFNIKTKTKLFISYNSYVSTQLPKTIIKFNKKMKIKFFQKNLKKL